MIAHAGNLSEIVSFREINRLGGNYCGGSLSCFVLKLISKFLFNGMLGICYWKTMSDSIGLQNDIARLLFLPKVIQCYLYLHIYNVKLTRILIGHFRRVKLKDASSLAALLALLFVTINVRLILVETFPQM